MKRPEQALHMAVAAYLSRALRPPALWTTIGHGGGGKTRGAILKAMGVHAGWPDIIIIWPYKTGPGKRDFDPQVLGIELKAGKKDMSPAQRKICDAFGNVHCAYEVCRSVDEVEDALRARGVPVYATTGARSAHQSTKLPEAA